VQGKKGKNRKGNKMVKCAKLKVGVFERQGMKESQRYGSMRKDSKICT